MTQPIEQPLPVAKNPGRITPVEIIAITIFCVLSATDYAYLLPWEWAHKVDKFALPAWIILSRILRLVRYGGLVDWVNQSRQDAYQAGTVRKPL